MSNVKLKLGDCLEVLKRAPDNYADSLVTDPPAGISFMGKDWDSDKGGRDGWVAWMTEVMKECNRVLKPGAHALVWAIPRTSHWTMTALENAGFEIRDVVTHLFGSGFPKSMNISIAIDKQAGAIQARGKGFNVAGQNVGLNANRELRSDHPDYVPPQATTPEAQRWQGFGTALKPACEFWVLCRKPLGEKTVAANVLKHGTGGLNIDGCRIEAADADALAKNWDRVQSAHQGIASTGLKPIDLSDRAPTGRFPANLVLSHSDGCTADACEQECAVRMLDEQSGERSSRPYTHRGTANQIYGKSNEQSGIQGYSDTGGASRFFYVAKASKSDRGDGNTHPTVKSTKLMRYLCKLITPPAGTILDPFMGSGSTGVAAIAEGFSFVGIEQSEEYFAIAERRLTEQDEEETA